MNSTNPTTLPTQYQQFIHLSRYARWDYDKKQRETWGETVERYFTFFREHLKEMCDYTLDNGVLEELRKEVLALNVMPSMRCLMTAGDALRKENVAGYNCSYVKVDSPRSFDEILYVLMNGCFHPNTLIKTKTGDVKISELTTEHEVMSYDIDKKQFEYIKPLWIVPTPHSIEKEKVELEFEDGTKVLCTTDHEFYTTNRGWVRADELSEEDDVKNYHEV